MKKKHAERSLTGLLAAWLLLMAVWLVPGSALARIAPSGREATPAWGAYEVPAEASMEMRGVSTVALGEGEESVAEGQREGVSESAGALRPAYTAERTSPEVSARVGRPRAPSGNGVLHFILGNDIKDDPNFSGMSFVVNSCNPSGTDDGKDYIFDEQEFKGGVGHFRVGLAPGLISGKNCECFELDDVSKGIFSYRGSQYEITVLVEGEVFSKAPYNQNGFAVWQRKYTNNVDIYIRKVVEKIPLKVKYYVDGNEEPLHEEGLNVVYDVVRPAGWDADSHGGAVLVPPGSTLQYSWEFGSTLDGDVVRPMLIKIDGAEVEIPEASTKLGCVPECERGYYRSALD